MTCSYHQRIIEDERLEEGYDAAKRLEDTLGPCDRTCDVCGTPVRCDYDLCISHS